VFYIQNRLTHILEEEKIPYTMKVPDENARGRGLYISKWMIVIHFLDEDGFETNDGVTSFLPIGVYTRNLVSKNEADAIDHFMEQIVKEFEVFFKFFVSRPDTGSIILPRGRQGSQVVDSQIFVINTRP
jgi:hypothetical protein